MAVPEFSSSLGQEAVDLSASCGLVLDPWQALVLEHALGRRDDGKWSAFEIGLVVSRQNGKGGVLEARELAGLFLLGEPLLIHSAHQFDTSLEAFLRLESLIDANAELSAQVRRVSRSHGEEGFALRNGSRIRYRTRTKGGGRGFSCDCLMLDEAMILPEFTHGALLPTLSARPNPQVWYTGSAVDQQIHEDGVVLARVRERGIRGADPSLAYFEYSVEDYAGDADEEVLLPDQVDYGLASDPQAWARANPGLGIRISLAHVGHELRSMDPRTFAVERLGIGDWPPTDRSAGSLIDTEKWDRLADAHSSIDSALVLAFDVSPSRGSSSISAAGRRPDGLAHVEVIQQGRGTGWVVDRLCGLVERNQPTALICDGKSPAAALLDELAERGVDVETVGATEHSRACGLFFDLVEEGRLRHLGTSQLRKAIQGAKTRPLGDAWLWARSKSSIDITPLVSATLALGKAFSPSEQATTWRAY